MLVCLALLLAALLGSCGGASGGGPAAQPEGASQLPIPDGAQYDSIAWTYDNPPPPGD